MATITIKIDSDELAREVLTQLGYLPGDDDIPDLISVEEADAEEVRPTGKTHVAAIHERMLGLDLPAATRKMPETPKQSAFCTTEDPREDVEADAEEVRPTGKTHVAATFIARMLGSDLPTATRKMPETPKQNAFCTTEDPKEDVEPVDNEMGAPLTDDMTKESDELYKQSLEVSKSIPSAEERLKSTADKLIGDELLNYLDAMCDHDNKKMREAAKAMVRKEFAGQTLTMWPALQKVLDGDA